MKYLWQTDSEPEHRFQNDPDSIQYAKFPPKKQLTYYEQTEQIDLALKTGDVTYIDFDRNPAAKQIFEKELVEAAMQGQLSNVNLHKDDPRGRHMLDENTPNNDDPHREMMENEEDLKLSHRS